MKKGRGEVESSFIILCTQALAWRPKDLPNEGGHFGRETILLFSLLFFSLSPASIYFFIDFTWHKDEDRAPWRRGVGVDRRRRSPGGPGRAIGPVGPGSAAAKTRARGAAVMAREGPGRERRRGLDPPSPSRRARPRPVPGPCGGAPGPFRGLRARPQGPRTEEGAGEGRVRSRRALRRN